MSNETRLKKSDIILIALALIIAVAVFLTIRLGRTDGGYAVVIQDGSEIAAYPLNRDMSVDIASPDGEGFNRLVISGGYASVSSASCPDKVCINQGRIKYNGETIVCLPNKLVIMITSDEQPQTDIIS